MNNSNNQNSRYNKDNSNNNPSKSGQHQGDNKSEFQKQAIPSNQDHANEKRAPDGSVQQQNKAGTPAQTTNAPGSNINPAKGSPKPQDNSATGMTSHDDNDVCATDTADKTKKE